MMRHLQLRIPLDKGVLASFLPTRLLDALTSNGHESVFIFFVISGFLIASTPCSVGASWAQSIPEPSTHVAPPESFPAC
jgi:peptidoglycan/LPS O-acetylase OafA/YrhL